MDQNQQIIKNYYELLQVSPHAEPEIITAAYRRLSQKYHPDVTNSNISSSRMVDINEAYEILNNPRKRVEYDRLIYNIYFINKQTSNEPRNRRRYQASKTNSYEHTQNTDYSYQDRNEYNNTRSSNTSQGKTHGDALNEKEARKEVIILTRNGLLKVFGGIAIISITWFLTRSIGALMAIIWIGVFLIIIGIVDIYKALKKS